MKKRSLAVRLSAWIRIRKKISNTVKKENLFLKEKLKTLRPCEFYDQVIAKRSELGFTDAQLYQLIFNQNKETNEVNFFSPFLELNLNIELKN